MTKEIFRESVFLKANGGKLTDSSSIDRRDIDAYMPAAVNYSVMAGYNITLKNEGNRDFSSLFYYYYPDLDVLIDTARHNWQYVNMPKRTIALPRNQGINTVEDGCGYNLKPLSDSAFRTIQHWKDVFTGDKYYRPQGNKIYLFNLPPNTKKIPVSMIVDIRDLQETDELPIPAGLETLAIDTCYQYITGERQVPADRKSDERDIN